MKQICSLMALAMLALFAFDSNFSTAQAQGTAFTYQGRLQSGANPATGTYDFTFALYSASSGGIQTGLTLTNLAVTVSNGLFLVSEDFGTGVYTGNTYWLQIGVRTNGGGSFNSLSPRQQLTPTPYAVYAENSASTALVSDPGTENFFAGAFAGTATLTGTHNTGVGYAALDDITTGVYNTAFGDSALIYTTTGSDNTAVGVYALEHTTSGVANSAFGADTLAFNTTGTYNTGVGIGAIEDNTTGSNNVGIGGLALQNATTDNGIVAIGYKALANDNAGGGLFGSGGNTAVGFEALQSDTAGSANTAVGWLAMGSMVGGYNNTACGWNALGSCTSGQNNEAFGLSALSALASGTGNIAIGVGAGQSYTNAESDNIDIGNSGNLGENNVIRLGTPGTQTDTYLTGNIHTPTGFVVDSTDADNGSLNAGWSLSFGGQAPYAGEGIGSCRVSGHNDTSGLDFYTDFTKRLVIQNGGNVGIGTDNPSALLDVTGNITCLSITLTSDRNSKEDFATVDARRVLEKVSALPLTEWKYKQDAAGAKHIGPMAQDFQAAFGLNGADDRHISVVDEGGVALAAIQGLNQKLEDENTQLKQQNESLSKRLGDLERAVQALAEKK